VSFIRRVVEEPGPAPKPERSLFRMEALRARRRLDAPIYPRVPLPLIVGGIFYVLFSVPLLWLAVRLFLSSRGH
jgi:hypothetical protein